MISDGRVFINGKPAKKAALEVMPEDSVTVEAASEDFVSRGGSKLSAALQNFSVTPRGKNCIDVGASHGGFTDCLLQNGARHVVAVDSGTDQLVEKLRCDKRVTSIEKFNARYMKADDLPYIPELAVMDVSFISATLIIPAVYAVLAHGADFICLVKPQFEVGKQNLGKGGIVKDEKKQKNALLSVVSFAESVGFRCEGTMISPIKGGDGNTEFLAHFHKI